MKESKTKTKKVEGIIIITAAGLFAWGLLRAFNRGDDVVRAWTTYTMLALVLFSAGNIFLRSRKIAVVTAIVCGLFIMIVMTAAILGPVEGGEHPILAVIRGISFFVFLEVASLIQIKSHKEE